MTDQSRRDVLQALAGASVAVPIPDVDLDRDDGEGDIPDINIVDEDLVWLALSSAVLHDDPDDAADVVGCIWDFHEDPSIDTAQIEEMSRAAARGDYDREIIERRAADVCDRISNSS